MVQIVIKIASRLGFTALCSIIIDGKDNVRQKKISNVGTMQMIKVI